MFPNATPPLVMKHQRQAGAATAGDSSPEHLTTAMSRILESLKVANSYSYMHEAAAAERARAHWLAAWQRWQDAPAEAAIELLNPPETDRTYSDADGRANGAPLSVLGSVGEWKVVSPDQSRWVALDLGKPRRVAALVLSCGALGRPFSGWVTRVRVYGARTAAPPTEDTNWTPLGPEIPTGCGSKPRFEHRVPLRELAWVRHVKVVPTEWKVSGAISTGEDLKPYISMRLAVLATRETYVDEDEQEKMIDQESESAERQRASSAAIAAGSGACSSTAAGKAGATVASWTAVDVPSLRGAKRHDGTGVRSAAVAATSLVPQTLLLRRREHFAPPSDEASATSSGPLDEAGLVCLFNLKRGHEIVQPADGVAPITAPSGEGVGRTSTSSPRHLEVVVRPAPRSRAESVAVGKLRGAERADGGQTSPVATMTFADTWLAADAYLDPFNEVQLEVNTDRLALTLRATHLRYACQRGTRLALASSTSHQEASGTVVHLCERTGQMVVSIDNTRSFRTFVAWARQHFGRAGRSVLHPVCVDPQPSTVALAMSIQHAPGTRLLVLRDGALLDVTVERCAGHEFGNRHTLLLRPAGSPDSSEARLEVDLNELNHSTQRFGSAGAFDAARRRYLERTLHRGALVEDAITGRFLKIAEQLLNLTMATGGEAVRDEVRAEGGLAGMADADLVWTLGEADLQPGDRVRHRGRLGHIGFRNGDGRRVFLGSATADASIRFYCGCAVGNEVCGGKLRDGSGPSCASCRSFTRENAELLRSELTDPRLHHVEFDHASASQRKRALCLAHELEKASPISGVHRDEWNGCAFRNGDVVYVEDGFVTHATSKKRVGLAYAYRPLRLSPLLNARTNTIEIEDGHVARRVRGQGGCVIGAEPLVFIDGVATFEVVIKRYAADGLEAPFESATLNAPRCDCLPHQVLWRR